MKQVIMWIQAHKIVVVLIFIAFAVWMIGLRFQKIQSDKGTYSDPVQKGTIIESVYGIGTVTANRTYQLKSGVTSIIRKLYVKEGDQVKRGNPLVAIEGTALMTAPFDGTITSLPFRNGESVFSQTVILNLVDLSDRYLVVSLEQQGAIHIRHGQKTKISFEGMRETSYEGVVESVYSKEDNFLVRINTPDLPPQILPGMTADVAIGIAEHKDVLVVPVASILTGRVQVKRNNEKPFSVQIKTGLIDGAMAELISGDIRPGDRLLILRKVAP
ncbi:MAG: efflux RND transporter periplasmic adaptor subunit [Nitrospirae bacterium]|nr:efflux RND transporter periplasmic adaptor subunit [Nitrospirota bacterium]MBI3595150.1 efflux RND transporter periplasmic adaptor subunit [Nitrospirota bacterium]